MPHHHHPPPPPPPPTSTGMPIDSAIYMTPLLQIEKDGVVVSVGNRTAGNAESGT